MLGFHGFPSESISSQVLSNKERIWDHQKSLFFRKFFSFVFRCFEQIDLHLVFSLFSHLCLTVPFGLSAPHQPSFSVFNYLLLLILDGLSPISPRHLPSRNLQVLDWSLALGFLGLVMKALNLPPRNILMA